MSFLLIKSRKSPCLLVSYRKLHSVIHSYSKYDQENPMVTCRIWVGETALVEHHGGGGKLTWATPVTYVRICWLNVNPWKKPQAVKLRSTTALVFIGKYGLLCFGNSTNYDLLMCYFYLWSTIFWPKKHVWWMDSSLAFKNQPPCAAWQMASFYTIGRSTNQLPVKGHISLFSGFQLRLQIPFWMFLGGYTLPQWTCGSVGFQREDPHFQGSMFRYWHSLKQPCQWTTSI